MDKRYEEALERAKQGMPIDEVFPELKESEDERIRTRLIALVEAFGQGEYKNEMLAYLEKQKEQKPNVESIKKSWYIEGYYDGKYNIEPKWLIQTGKGGPRYEENPKYGTQKPAEWSEEDEKMRIRCIEIFDLILKSSYVYAYTHDCKNWCENRLKSLRPQPHWKPSEEQIQALTVAIDEAARCEDPYWRDSLHDVLLSLHNDLLKLL